MSMRKVTTMDNDDPFMKMLHEAKQNAPPPRPQDHLQIVEEKPERPGSARSHKSGASKKEGDKTPIDVDEETKDEKDEFMDFEAFLREKEEAEIAVVGEPWKDAAYWQLPENVRNAIDIAKEKSAHSEFYYKLENLNEKLMIFKMLFYSKMPHHQ